MENGKWKMQSGKWEKENIMNLVAIECRVNEYNACVVSYVLSFEVMIHS